LWEVIWQRLAGDLADPFGLMIAVLNSLSNPDAQRGYP
jgi:hypothetical protein